jgi:hypothetical protein
MLSKLDSYNFPFRIESHSCQTIHILPGSLIFDSQFDGFVNPKKRLFVNEEWYTWALNLT